MNIFVGSRKDALAKAAELGGEICIDEENEYDATVWPPRLGIAEGVRSMAVRTETETHSIFYL